MTGSTAKTQLDALKQGADSALGFLAEFEAITEETGMRANIRRIIRIVPSEDVTLWNQGERPCPASDDKSPTNGQRTR